MALIDELGFVHKWEELVHDGNIMETTFQMSATDISTQQKPQQNYNDATKKAG